MKKFLNNIKSQIPGLAALKKLRESQSEHSQITQLVWFAQLPIFLVIVAILVIYVVIAAKSRETLNWVDQFVTPTVNALHYLGLGITQPFIAGPKAQSFYSNLVGLGVWGALVFNARTILYAISHQAFPSSPKRAENYFMIEKNYGRLRAWLACRFVCLFVFIPTVMVFTIFLLNGINGWFVFHYAGFFDPMAATLVFVVGPGAYVSTLVLACLAYVVYDIKQIFQLS